MFTEFISFRKFLVAKILSKKRYAYGCKISIINIDASLNN